MNKLDYETLSTKIPAELKDRIRKHKINASKVMRDALKREVAKAEAEEIDRRLEHISTSLDKIKIEESVAGIGEDRDSR